MAYCRNCGKEILDNVDVCIHCGLIINGNRAYGTKLLYQTPSFWLLFSAGIIFLITLSFHTLRIDYIFIYFLLIAVFILLSVAAFVTSFNIEKKGICSKTYVFSCLFVMIFSIIQFLMSLIIYIVFFN